MHSTLVNDDREEPGNMTDTSTNGNPYRTDADAVRRLSGIVTPRPFSISSVSGLSNASATSGGGPVIRPVSYQPIETAAKYSDGPLSPKPNLDISGVFANYAKTRKVSLDGPLSPTLVSPYSPTKAGKEVETVLSQIIGSYYRCILYSD